MPGVSSGSPGHKELWAWEESLPSGLCCLVWEVGPAQAWSPVAAVGHRVTAVPVRPSSLPSAAVPGLGVTEV